MTVSQLAAATGVSTGLISQVERTLADPSLETLRKIAKALDVPLFDLFRDQSTGPTAVVTRARRMLVQSPSGDITYSRVSPGYGRLEVLEGHLQPGAASAADPWSHSSPGCTTWCLGDGFLRLLGVFTPAGSPSENTPVPAA